MGKRQMKQFDDVPHLWIQKPVSSYFGISISHILNAPKPKDLDAIIHDIVWLIFTSQLEQYVPKFYIWKRILSIVFICLLVISALVGLMNETLFHIGVKYLGPVWSVLILSWVFLYLLLLQCNKYVDDKVRQVCETFEKQFQKQGFRIEYKTEYTDICDFKLHYSYRIILFHPINAQHSISIEVTKTTDDTNHSDSETEIYCDHV